MEGLFLRSLAERLRFSDALRKRSLIQTGIRLAATRAMETPLSVRNAETLWDAPASFVSPDVLYFARRVSEFSPPPWAALLACGFDEALVLSGLPSPLDAERLASAVRDRNAAKTLRQQKPFIYVMDEYSSYSSHLLSVIMRGARSQSTILVNVSQTLSDFKIDEPPPCPKISDPFSFVLLFSRQNFHDAKDKPFFELSDSFLFGADYSRDRLLLVREFFEQADAHNATDAVNDAVAYLVSEGGGFYDTYLFSNDSSELPPRLCLLAVRASMAKGEPLTSLLASSLLKTSDKQRAVIEQIVLDFSENGDEVCRRAPQRRL